MFSTRVVLLALSIKIVKSEGKADIYHLFCMPTPILDVSKILFKSLLNIELKSLIFLLGLALRFDRSLIKVVVVWSSPNLVKDCSSQIYPS